MSRINTGSMSDFSDPFFSPSSLKYPTTLNSALDLALFLYNRVPIYAQASRRVYAHFITSVEATGQIGSHEEKRERQEFFTDQLRLLQISAEAGMDMACYGNCFATVTMPFDRYLKDTRDGRYALYSVDQFRDTAKFNLQTMTYQVPDPRNPGKQVSLPFEDFKSTDRNRIAIKLLEPTHCIIEYSNWTKGYRIIYRFREDYVANIRRGFMPDVNTTPIGMLQAIRDNCDFRFDADEVFQFRVPTVTGVMHTGWGLPPPIANFRNLFQLELYRRTDEAVALDYMLPLRIVSPQGATATGDIFDTMHMGAWRDSVMDMVAQRRKDPTSIQAFPFPVAIQETGASGKQFAPKDLIEWQTNNTLDCMGYPAELFRGTLEYQQVPTALRLFEGAHRWILDDYNSFVKWVSRKVDTYLGVEHIPMRMRNPALADQIEDKQIILQMLQGGDITRARAMRFIGIDDPVGEATARTEEDLEIEEKRQEAQQKFQNKMQNGTTDAIMAQQQAAAQQGGGAPPSGAGPVGEAQGGGGGGALGPTPSNVPITPMDIDQQAQDIAQALLPLTHQNPGQYRRELANYKATNPTLHAAIKQKLDEARSQGASQGRAQASQPQQ